MEAPNYELMSALATLLEAGKYSDLSIVCGSRRWAVHRAIICSRSGFFDGACSSPFREAETGVVDLSEDDEEAVEHMVQYFYHLDYLRTIKSRRTSRGSSVSSNTPPASPTHRRRRSKRFSLAFCEDPLLATAAYTGANPHISNDPFTPPEDTPDPLELLKIPPPEDALEDAEVEPLDLVAAEREPDVTQPHLVAHAKVYAIAEKYDIAGLKSLARRKFSSQMSLHYNSAEFPEATECVYETTVDSDRGLRDIVIQTFREHPEMARRKDIEAVIKVTPGLAWELFRIAWGMPI